MKHLRYGLLLCLILLCLPATLSAQLYGTPDENTGLFISATTTSTGIAAGLIILAVAEVNRSPQKINAFLKQNGKDFQAELILGAGQTLDDFAYLLAIEDKHLKGFQKLMRKNRTFVNALAQDSSIENTTKLLAWIEEFYPLESSKHSS